MKNPEIVYEDKDIIVCYKPAGYPTESARIGQMDLISYLKNFLSARDKKNGIRSEIYVGMIHRLDQPVEGVLVFAKNKKAAAELSNQIRNNKLKKQYYCAAYGTVKDENAVLENYLKKGKDNLAHIVSAESDGGKLSRLSFEKIREVHVEGESYTYLKIELDTGRFHQIRAQLSNYGNPLLGDQKYGSEASANLSKKLNVKSVALCASRIEFVHPVTQKEMSLEVEPENSIFDLMND
ncbi:MAG: RluA family pseudouridine synthase [Butyrivibrio sp.]|nr:RluA family pseudouridine synthase [Butyrivibrio sp.]